MLLARFLNYIGNDTPEDAWECYDEQFAAWLGGFQILLLSLPPICTASSICMLQYHAMQLNIQYKQCSL